MATTRCRGENASGERCRRTVRGDAKYCYAHTEGRRAQEKADFLEAYSDTPTTVQQAARRIGRDETTIRRWAKRDPEFGARYEEAKADQHEMRLNRVEDALFQRIVRSLGDDNVPDLAAGVIIFWLKANGGDRYRLADQTNVNLSGNLAVQSEQDMEARIDLYRNLLSGSTAGDGESLDAPADS